jgi:hypothetical protein
MEKDKFISKSKRDSTALAFKISDNVQVKDVRIIESSFRQTPNATKGSKSVDIDNTANVEFDMDNSIIFVIADFNLKAFVEKDTKPAVSIHASFLLRYDFSDGFEKYPDEAFKLFAEMNGVFNAWPYWREFVQSATVRMGLPALTIPVFRVHGPKKAAQPSKKVAKKKKTKKKSVAKKSSKKKVVSKAK